jgi:hypothetical protein
VRRCGRHIGITRAPKNFEVVIRGWGGKEGVVRCGEGKGFSREAIHEIGHSVKALNPISRRETCRIQKGAHNII